MTESTGGKDVFLPFKLPWLLYASSINEVVLEYEDRLRYLEGVTS